VFAADLFELGSAIFVEYGEAGIRVDHPFTGDSSLTAKANAAIAAGEESP
jgi:hypothetical protein